MIDFEMVQVVQVQLELEKLQELFDLERFQVVPNLLHLSTMIPHSPQTVLHIDMINMCYISQNSP